MSPRFYYSFRIDIALSIKFEVNRYFFRDKYMWVYLLLAIVKRTCWNKCLFSFLGKQIEKLSYFLTNRFIQPFFRGSYWY